MYRRPKFLEKLIAIREEMAKEADYDVDLFAEMARSGNITRRKQASPDAVSVPVHENDRVTEKTK